MRVASAEHSEKRKIQKKNFSILIKRTALFNKTKNRNAFIIGTCMGEWTTMGARHCLVSRRHIGDGTYPSRLAFASKTEQKLLVAGPPAETRLVRIYYCHTKSECIPFGAALKKSERWKASECRRGCLLNIFFQRLAKTDIAPNFVFVRA